ncbi:MAG: bacteriohopanetetrol glucosamine biosynthesis glycosyltransferase HpnI [Kiloniellales bacterium]
MSWSLVEAVLLVPVLGGALFYLASLVTALMFFRRATAHAEAEAHTPPVTILKPIYGLERELERNLRSACTQDYPDYQVVLSVQRLDDPALPLLRRMERDYGSRRVTVVAAQSEPVVNGKVQNLQNALSAARHEVLVISDSDVFTPPGYLKSIVAPLRDPEMGYACTLYKGADARSWYEQLELLTYNADFVPSSVFAYQTGASGLCLGASVALHRRTLEAVGGLESLADYLVEDYELGRRILQRGQRMVLVPYFVDLTVDLNGPASWWRHQVYWDQNTRAARPAGFVASVLTRALPFALLYAALRLFDPLGLAVLAATLAVRLGTAAGTAALFGDSAGLRALWLLPLRDAAGLVFWCLALGKRRFVWRDHEFELTRDGRIVPRPA